MVERACRGQKSGFASVGGGDDSLLRRGKVY